MGELDLNAIKALREIRTLADILYNYFSNESYRLIRDSASELIPVLHDGYKPNYNQPANMNIIKNHARKLHGYKSISAVEKLVKFIEEQ